MKRKIPRCMSTQHPDNVTIPFFSEKQVIGGEDEIKETYYAFSHLGCSEQMWDQEGKEVDAFVVKKLLSTYPDFFQENRIGESFFITPRVPNPEFERAEAKFLLETLESIPRSFDTAVQFYGRDCSPPIFEVILPMTTSSKALNKIYYYYKDFVGGKGNFVVAGEKVSKWIGSFKPEKISVIPLLEDSERLSRSGRLLKEYLHDKNPDYQRVFLARSDPAMNYGLLGAVLLSKISLAKLDGVSRDTGVPIYPIIGVGSCIFRGGFSPIRVKETLTEYPSVSTFTVQSAFKYDWPSGEVSKAIREVSLVKRKAAQEISEKEEKEIKELIQKHSKCYQKQILKFSDLINFVASYVPHRRRRKLHIGIWGYSRKMGKKHLPRAIGFTAALYSLGFPPEIISLESLDDSDLSLLKKFYKNFLTDISEAASFTNFENKLIPKKTVKKLQDLVSVETNEEHKKLTSELVEKVRKRREGIQELIVRSGCVRKFLG